MSQYKHIKGLKPQSPSNLKISHDDYKNLIAGEEVNLSSSEVKELESLGVKLEKAGTSSFSQPTIKKSPKKKKGDK